MNFGEKLTKLIETSGETRQDIADALGFRSKSNISYYEKTPTLPKTEILIKFCDYFGVPIDYFNETTKSFLHQPEKEYRVLENKIPVYSNESENAAEISYMVIPHSGIVDGFAIVVEDDRLESIGISCGSTVILSRKVNLSKKHKVIVRCGKESFFATYEKFSDSYAVIVPVKEGAAPIILDGSKKKDVEIVAVVKSVIYNED